MMLRSAPACILLLAGLATACSSGPSAPDDATYVSELAAAREDKNRQFRETPGDPIPADRLGTMLPLNYYPIDMAYSVPAALQIGEEQPVFQMPTSTGTLRPYRLVGTLEFTLEGQSHSLGAFVPAGTQQIGDLFVPFADLTTGEDTYVAGRYLDVRPTATGYYTIDFNRAYNPYCAYNASYECPFPPPSNRLKVAIRAGEMNPSGT